MLEYVCTEGQFSLHAMNDEHERWLPARTSDIADGDKSRRALSVDVAAGSTFSLYISNYQPHHDGVSRVDVRRLTGSVPPNDLLRPAIDRSGARQSPARSLGGRGGTLPVSSFPGVVDRARARA